MPRNSRSKISKPEVGQTQDSCVTACSWEQNDLFIYTSRILRGIKVLHTENNF